MGRSSPKIGHELKCNKAGKAGNDQARHQCCHSLAATFGAGYEDCACAKRNANAEPGARDYLVAQALKG